MDFIYNDFRDGGPQMSDTERTRSAASSGQKVLITFTIKISTQSVDFFFNTVNIRKLILRERSQQQAHAKRYSKSFSKKQILTAK